MICYDMTSLKKALLLMDKEFCYLRTVNLTAAVFLFLKAADRRGLVDGSKIPEPTVNH